LLKYVVNMAYNQSLQPTAYVAGAPSASAEFNRYVLNMEVISYEYC